MNAASRAIQLIGVMTRWVARALLDDQPVQSSAPVAAAPGLGYLSRCDRHSLPGDGHMAKRALLIGSQTGALRGVGTDLRRMTQVLAREAFSIDERSGSSATRDGILDGYRALIRASGGADAILVYYSGHGGIAASPASFMALGWLNFASACAGSRQSHWQDQLTLASLSRLPRSR